MIKTAKVKRLIEQNGIQIQNFTMVIRLKKIIQELNQKIKSQQQTIMMLKRDTKTTKINQMQVQIQHLNDQNKRLTIMIEQEKSKYKKQINNYRKLLSNSISNTFHNNEGVQLQRKFRKNNKKKSSRIFDTGCLTSKSSVKIIHQQSNTTLTSTGGLSSFNGKKTYQQIERQKEQIMKQRQKQKKFQKKYYQILQETQRLKKQLINYRISDCPSVLSKKRNPTNQHQRSSIILMKNMSNLQKITQKKHDLQLQNQLLRKKNIEGEKKSTQLLLINQKYKNQLHSLEAELQYLMNKKNNSPSEKCVPNDQQSIFKDLTNSLKKSEKEQYNKTKTNLQQNQNQRADNNC